jgi:outer membrane protein
MKNYLLTVLVSVVFLFFNTIESSAQVEETKVWTLNECIEYAFENNIQIQQTAISNQISKANLSESKFATLPTLNGFANHVYNFGQTIDPFTNSFATSQVQSNALSLSTSLLVFNGFQNINNIKRNQADYNASMQELERIKNDISLNITNFYLQILFNKELVENSENQLKVTQVQVERIQKLVDVGNMPEGNLREIEAQQASEELQLINAKNQLMLSKLSLAQLLRIENARTFDIEEPNLENFEGRSSLIPASDLYETALDIMPEIKSAEYSFYSAEKSTQIAKSGYYPRLVLNGSLGSGYSGANTEITNISNPRYVPTLDRVQNTNQFIETLTSDITRQQKKWDDQLDDNFNQSIGLSLNIPIFNGLSARRNVERAKLNAESAALELENAKLSLRQNIETAHTEAVAALKRFHAAEKSVNSLKLSFEYTQKRFDVGAVNSFDFNNEKNRLSNAESELLQAKYEYIFRTKVLDFYKGEALNLE